MPYLSSPLHPAVTVTGPQPRRRLKSLPPQALPALLLALACAWLAPPATAAVVTTFNTGVGNGGAGLPDTSLDPHYVLVGPSPSQPAAYALDGSSTPIPFAMATNTWLATGSNPLSLWIAPATNGIGVIGAPYAYQTKFDLTGLLPATAVFSGQWAAGTLGTRVFVNNDELVGLALAQVAGASAWSPFGFTGTNVSLNPGINTLTFYTSTVNDFQGLRVQWAGQADAAQLPEPGSLALVSLALMGLGLPLWRRRPQAHANHPKHPMP